MATRKKIPLIPSDATLTIGAGKTISSSVDLDVSGADVTIVGSGTNTITFPASTDTLVGRDTTDTLTNKTLTTPVISSITNTGTLTLPTSTGTVALTSDITVTASSTTTFTNKRINPRVVTAASYTTDTGTSLDVSTCDEFDVTAQAGALKFNNPGGTPVNGQKLIVRIKDDGTARALTYDTQFRAMGNALPSTTVLGKTLYMGLIYNSADTKWDLIAVAQEI